MAGKSIFDKDGEMFNPHKFTPSFKDELSALKKVNQIGKKLAWYTGKYIMYNGMLFGYNDDLCGAHSVSVVFLDAKLVNSLTPLQKHITFIKGIDFYQTVNSGKFVGYDEFCNRTALYFEKEETIKEEFDIENFITWGKYKGYAEYDIIVAYKKGWETNMDVYNGYLKYLSTLKTVTKMVRYELPLSYVSHDNYIFNKLIPIVDEIREHGTLIARKDIRDEELQTFNITEEPTEYWIDRLDGRGEVLVRIMKSLFHTMSTSSKLSIQVIDVGKEYQYLMTIVDNGGTYTCNIWKMLPLIED